MALFENEEKLREAVRALVFVLKNKIIATSVAPLPDTPELDPSEIPGTYRCGRNTSTQISRSFCTA